MPDQVKAQLMNHIDYDFKTDLSHNARKEHLPWTGRSSTGGTIVNQFYATRLGLFGASRTSLDERLAVLREEDSERGAISLETVAIAAGLLAAAVLLVLAITTAVTGRLAGIN